MSINKKEIPIGTIVYFIKKDGWKPTIQWGVIAEHYVGEICVELYDFKENRILDGKPISDYTFPTRWSKLPKHWTYNTKLFDLSFDDDIHTAAIGMRIDNPNDLQKLIDDGIFVKVWDKDYYNITTEVDKNKGWRIIRQSTEYHQPYIMIRFDKVYTEYNQAIHEFNEINREFERQANLTDEEWSIEQIAHDLNRWAKMYQIPDDTKLKYAQYIFSHDDIVDIETRVFMGRIQWKYWKNKKWLDIDLEV